MGQSSWTPLDCRVTLVSGCQSILLAALAVMSGCATGRYTAEKLPDRFRARPTDNVQTVGLANLASPTAQTDLIARGDVLQVNLSSGMPSEEDLERIVRVNEQGSIYLAELGHVKVDSLTLQAAEGLIGTECMTKELYRTPQVTVTMKQPMVNRVLVTGAVKEEGEYALRSGQSNLLAAIMKAGGLADNAGTTVEVRHPGYVNGTQAPEDRTGTFQVEFDEAGVETASFTETVSTRSGNVLKVDLVSATKQPSGGVELPDGAVIHVERHDPDPVHVMGLVNKAGEYEFPVGKEMRLTSAVALAGDISNPLADKVYVIRHIEGEPEPVVVELSLKKAKEHGAVENITLAPGDTVSVEKTPATIFYDTIRIISFGVGGSVF